MDQAGNVKRKKAFQERSWRDLLLRSPFFRIDAVVPFGLVSLLLTGYLFFSAFVLRHKLSRFEIHFTFLSLFLSLIYSGLLSIVRQEAWGKWRMVYGTEAVVIGSVVLLLGIGALIVYVAIATGLL